MTSTSIILSASEVVALARYRARSMRPFFQRGLLAMKPIAVADIGGTSVDCHWRYYYDPEVVQAWGVDRTAFDWLRKLQHLLRKHDKRRAACEADDLAWALGAVMEIDDDLRDPNGLLPTAFEWPTGLLAEDYATRFRIESRGYGCCLGGSGLGLPPLPWEIQQPRLALHEVIAVRREIARSIAASRSHLGYGSTPGFWQDWAELEIAPVALDWTEVLRGLVATGVSRAAGREDRSYLRLDKRSAAFRLDFGPASVRQFPRIAVVVDTSGSMPDEALGRALGVVEGVAAAADGSILVVPCDARVGRIVEVRTAREAKEQCASGRGGTNMGAALQTCEQMPDPPSVVVVVTDNETPWPDAAPRGFQVVVATLPDQLDNVPKWARGVAVKLDEREEANGA